MTKKDGSKQVRKRLYRCDDCGERRFVSWVELNRAAKPRCYKCGSTRLDLVSEEARQDQARLNTQRLIGTGGSLHLASEADKTHRAVVGGGVEIHNLQH